MINGSLSMALIVEPTDFQFGALDLVVFRNDVIGDVSSRKRTTTTKLENDTPAFRHCRDSEFSVLLTSNILNFFTK